MRWKLWGIFILGTVVGQYQAIWMIDAIAHHWPTLFAAYWPRAVTASKVYLILGSYAVDAWMIWTAVRRVIGRGKVVAARR